MPLGAFKKILSVQGISSPGKNSKTYKWKNTYIQWIFRKFVLVKQILSPENLEKNPNEKVPWYIGFVLVQRNVSHWGNYIVDLFYMIFVLHHLDALVFCII